MIFLFSNAKVPCMISHKAVFNGIAAASALTSAVFWFGASKIRISVWGDAAARESGDPTTVDEIDFFATVAEQAKWNRWAALVTGIAAVCQALALILPN